MDEQSGTSGDGRILGRRQVIGAAGALVIAPVAIAMSYDASARGDATPAASPAATPDGTPAAMQTLEAFDFGYEPSTLEVEVGETLELFSTGGLPHNVVIEGYDGDPVDFPQDGSSIEWTIPEDLEPGTYTFYCGIGNHRAQGMEGEITVAEASGEDTDAGAGTTVVEAFDFGFEPSTFEAAPGETLDFFSSGSAPHNFIIEGFEDDVVDYPEDGSTVQWTVPEDLPAGRYIFYCGIGSHRAQGMEGEITITD